MPLYNRLPMWLALHGFGSLAKMIVYIKNKLAYMRASIRWVDRQIVMIIKVKAISYSVLAFIALFCYLYPIAFNFLHLCGILYFIFYVGRYLNKKIYEMLRIAILVMIIGLSATGVYNNAYDLSLIKKILSFFFISFFWYACS